MIIFAAGAVSALMLLSGCLLLVYVLMRKAHLRQEAERGSRIVNELDRLPPPQAPWKTANNGGELAELTRDLNGQLSTKIVVLERLIADSQKQIERMEELLEKLAEVKSSS